MMDNQALTFAAIHKRIKKNNEAFRKSTPLQQRVAIAKDVLRLIETKKIVPKRGTYFAANEKMDFGAERDIDSLSGAFKKMPSCQVCALGAVFVTTVLKLNHINVGDVRGAHYRAYRDLEVDATTMQEFLRICFDSRTLFRMEAFFEMSVGFLQEKDAPTGTMMYEVIHDLRHGTSTPKERLRFVMNTVIEQKGKFEPWRTAVYKSHVRWVQQKAKQDRAVYAHP